VKAVLAFMGVVSSLKRKGFSLSVGCRRARRPNLSAVHWVFRRAGAEVTGAPFTNA
jgi:hypothetical protein